MELRVFSRRAEKNKGKGRVSPAPGSAGGAAAAEAAADDDEGGDDESSMDEVERALLEVCGTLDGDGGDGDGYGDADAAAAAAAQGVLLATNQRWVNPDAETRRMFGARAVEDARAGGGGGGGGGGGLGAAGPGRRGATRQQRSVFVTPGADWPRFLNPGIEMVRRDTDGGGFEFELRIDDTRYAEAREAFEAAVETYDHHYFFEVLRHHPYCVHALAQLSDVYRQHGQHEQSDDLNARVLFAFERSFHSDFDPFSGTCRLPRDSEAADLFYHALFRHMTIAGARGCTATAFELSRLLLSLDPGNDPAFALLLMDHYALRAGRYRALLAMLSTFEDGALSCMPNWAYAGALAVKRLAAAGGGAGSSSSGSSRPEAIDRAEGAADLAALDPDRMLEHAILLFPSVIVPLFVKCGVTVVPAGQACVRGFVVFF
jgi:hypothetical protein